jgi:hydrogenase maturation protease
VTTPVLVLGLGNELFSDEGVGVVASRRIAESDFPDTEVVDGGTLGLSLLPTIEGRDALLVLDAIVESDLAPGSVVVYDGEDLRREARLLYSAHQLGVNEVLAAADLAGVAPLEVAAVGMVPESVDTGYGITDTAAMALDEMVAVARRVLIEFETRRLARA